MGKYFGTDGFRGEANVVLTADHAYRVGRFLGWYYKELHKQNGNEEKSKIVIGKDTRRSSYMFEYSLCAGITASGSDVYIMHVTPTPSVAYIARVDEFDCGIMISASHNPYYDNGIKLLSQKGDKMDDATTQLVEDYLDGEVAVFGKTYHEVPFAKRDEIGSMIDYMAGRNRYIGYLISLGVYSFKGKKVGLDCANGASWQVAKPVFEAMGATVHAINCSPDGLNENLNAGSTHIEGLQKLVRDEHLDLGFAYDGDADRCLAVDENGEIVNGDQIMYIYAKYMKDRNRLFNDEVVTTIMSNLGLYKALEREGIHYTQTSVGDRFVREYMEEHGNLIGGEQSGHIIFSKYATTGDGILTSLKVMQCVISKKTTLGTLASEVPMYPQSLVNVPVKDKKAAMENSKVLEELKKAEAFLGNNGRVLLRPSGTEPVVRVMAEAKDKATCDQAIEGIVNALKAIE